MSSNDDFQVYVAEPVDLEKTKGYAGNLVHSFGHSLVQGPIDGVREVVNTLSGTKIIPNIQLIKPPERAEVSTPEWEAQKIGSGAGLLAAGMIIIGFLVRRR